MGTSVYFCPMPKVLQIVNRLNLGGITYNAASIAARIRPEFETMIVAGMKDDTEESSEFMLKELGLEAVYIPNMMREISPVQDFKAYLHLLKIIRAYKPDIVHTHAAKAGLIGRLAAKTAGVPVIVHTYHGHVFHSYFGKIKTKIILGIERFLGKISTGIIAISEKQKKELGEVYKVTRPEKIHVIELGYDLTPFQTNVEEKRKQFRAQYGIATDTVVIGVIGRLVSIKNLPFLIRIWQRITTAKNLNIKCFLIGDGEDRPQLELLCKETGIAYSTPEQPNRNATLVFTSWIFNPDLALAGVDIVALCSHNEGTPASLIEAQAAGKPIITTDVGGISNIVVPDQTAILIKAGDERSFEEQLLRLIEDAALRNRLSEKGPAFATGRFHFDRLTRDIKDFYRHLLTKHSE
jgi:glycosyltransferase involved in cell wall biosynthesis